MSAIAESAIAAGSHIGRYFTVVGMVPALAAVAWTTFLLSAGAWHGPFEPGQSIHAIPELSLGGISTLVAVSLVVALLINPFQFPMTQILEGYWGGGRLASRIGAWRINAHRADFRDWLQRSQDASDGLIAAALGTLPTDRQPPKQQEFAMSRGILAGEDGDTLIWLDLIAQHGPRLQQRFPPSAARILPTRLGNTLRAFEDRAGKEYGLDAVAIAPHLSLLGANPRTAYVEDTRQTMDLSIRLLIAAVLCVPVTAVLLSDDGPWVLLAFAPYMFAYLAYRGAISAASAYGHAVTVQVDLDRFALYEALHLPLPNNASQERSQNQRLCSLLRERRADAQLSFRHPAPPPT